MARLKARSRTTIATLALLALISITTHLTFSVTNARAAAIDYVGFAWESGGLATSVPGDVLSVATVITQIDVLFGVDLAIKEATLYIDGLTSLGSTVDPISGATVINYSGGTLSVYAHTNSDHDWGVSPANATVPSTFINGELIFQGVFTSFSVIRQSSGLGIFEGYIDATGGSALLGPCTGCAYTFAGNFAAPTGAQIPQGYDLQVDGILEVSSAVAVEPVAWGTLKQLYRPNQ